MKISAKPLFALSAMLALCGCAIADMADYPSLARRPIERRAIEQTANVVRPTSAPAPVPAVVSAALVDALRGLLQDARAGNAAFATLVPPAERSAAARRTAAVGSEAWVNAQLALSRLEASRAPTVLALAELDRLAIDQADRGDNAATAAITPVQIEVEALVAAQSGILDRLD